MLEFTEPNDEFTDSNILQKYVFNILQLLINQLVLIVSM